MFWSVSYNLNYRSGDGTVHRVVNWREFGSILKFGCGNTLTSGGTGVDGATKETVTCMQCIVKET